jgi:hypothetical protein
MIEHDSSGSQTSMKRKKQIKKRPETFSTLIFISSEGGPHRQHMKKKRGRNL